MRYMLIVIILLLANESRAYCPNRGRVEIWNKGDEFQISIDFNKILSQNAMGVRLLPRPGRIRNVLYMRTS